ncbi:MAG: hypothetical protein FJ202_10595 [Gemmatimonadetes bacterium]|nr:hypothetical protein [Gemmatimonadota bacterium]
MASVLVAGALAVPLWRIDLIAPQYPEGLGLLIRANTITGIKPQDLKSINGLNHYIGMAEIVPESIPELRYMPYILMAFAGAALLVAIRANRTAILSWLVAFGLLGVAGMADMYKWGYDYGHNLSPNAIIKVPGMSYQPPLIGSKKMLNFRAVSLPAAGGWMLGLAGGLAFAALMVGRRRGTVAALAVAAAAAACTPGPREIVLHQDACSYCRMTISDARFGGQVVMRTGKIETFDSVECLVSWRRTADTTAIAGTYVMDLEHPGTLVNAETAGFLRGATVASPMGGAMVAFATPAAAATKQSALGGTLATWDDLQREPTTQSGVGSP